MNRLQNKCLIVSVSLHAVLVAILLLAPAFSKPEKKPDPPKPISLIHGALVAKALAAAAPAAAPRPDPAPKPAPAPTPAPKKPTPPKKVDPPKPKPAPKPVPKKVTPKKSPPKKQTVKPKPAPKPVIKTTKVKSRPKPKPKPKTRTKPKITVKIPSVLKTRTDPDKERREREERDRRLLEEKRRVAKQRADLHAKLNRVTSVKFTSRVSVKAFGGSSRASSDYGSHVYQVYKREWRKPGGIQSSSKTVVSVTISKSGRLIRAQITRKSGVSQLDSSIAELIRRVQKFNAFPIGMTEAQKTYIIEFNTEVN
jgi:TonB family protein